MNRKLSAFLLRSPKLINEPRHLIIRIAGTAGWFFSLICYSATFVLCPGAHAANLMQAYRDALAHDPLYAQARATYRAAKEDKPSAWAALLPHLSANAGGSWGHTSGSSAQVISDVNGALYAYNLSTLSHSGSKMWSLTLTDTLFSWKNWMVLKAADRQVAAAAIAYKAAKEHLMLRTADAYFNVLASLDALAADRTTLNTLSYSLKKAQAAFSVGLEPAIGVEQARAARDRGEAVLIKDEQQVSDAEGVLESLTGTSYRSFAEPGKSFPLIVPAPSNEKRWERAALKGNAGILSKRLALAVAQDRVQEAYGAELPSLRLVATRSYNNTVSNQQVFGQDFSGLGSNENDSEIALEVSVPLFSGGADTARVHKRTYEREAAEDALRYAVEQTREQSKRAYLGILSGIANIKALKTALSSSEASFKATEEGYAAGSESETAVLQALSALRQTRRAYATARYAYLMSILKLEQAAGTLNVRGLAMLNHWLTATSPTARH